jgi:hypothetical protein
MILAFYCMVLVFSLYQAYWLNCSSLGLLELGSRINYARFISSLIGDLERGNRKHIDNQSADTLHMRPTVGTSIISQPIPFTCALLSAPFNFFEGLKSEVTDFRFLLNVIYFLSAARSLEFWVAH